MEKGVNILIRKFCTRFTDFSAFPQLFLRTAIAIGYISPVLDRLGILGLLGSSDNVTWGNWSNFLDYTHTLLPIFNRSITNILGATATVCEVLFAILLLIGYKIKIAALGSAFLSLTFALCMGVFLYPTAPISYSVFTFSAASLLLATLPNHSWSLDSYLSKK